MSLTVQDRNGHRLYQDCSRITRGVIDSAYEHVAETLKAHGITPVNDDRAEALVAAITRYLFECEREKRKS